MSDNIKVVVKVRPLILREIEDKLSYQWRVKNNTLYQLDQNGKDLGQAFTFDKVYDQETKTSDVYNDIAKPIVEAATAGFNGTIFAYGQTSSGKTYTMSGTDDSPGIIPLAVLDLFKIIKSIPDRDFLVRVSFIEIYNETVKDLLNIEKDNVKVQDTLRGVVKVYTTEKVTSSPEEVLEAMKEGEANRQTGATNMNEQSSRSHSIFQITIESREHIEGESEGGCVNVSQLNLVDLAGSERAGQTGAKGIRFKEGTHINKSLSTLALVIKQLSEDHKFVSYRDSKLTRLLQNSLGGNAKTSIICAVTPVAVEETISTLQFANRAKAIKNKPEVNAVATDATMIQSLTKQMSQLQSQLERKKSLEQDNYKLQNKINALQRLILNGFGRSSMEINKGARRKLPLPRRVTIHSTASEFKSEPVVEVPKFCTPSLKYNPALLAPPAETALAAGGRALASVPEEPARAPTPPRPAVSFRDEVINLDSDDDMAQEDHDACSPFHKCYGSTKTPPCILRKNRDIAEKHLKDIIELTEREKIFSPSAVELMEKLEENSTVIAKLQDEMELLNKKCKEKDLENEILKSKLEKKETELKVLNSAKDDVQTECEKYKTKLTDMEVICETLKHKAKLREEELLSLLEEMKVKQPQDIDKISCNLEKDINFMDMSKEVSLVNSDNENSIIPDDATEDVINIITDTQIQLTSKNQSIIELEADLFSHKQKIVLLENLTQELEQTVSTFKEKLVNVETENSLLTSSLETLNMTINNQQENLQSANNDIESYNRVIQELKMKLTQRENLFNIDINDSLLENMITNEEHFIANNENMMNIIHSFKIAIDARNKEITELKDKDREILEENKNLVTKLQGKTEQINTLNSVIDDLKSQVNENVLTIKKLTHENNDYTVGQQELISKLNNLETKNRRLEEINNENTGCLQNLKEENSRLKLEDTHTNLIEQISELTTKIGHLSKTCAEKDDLIVTLNKSIYQSKEFLCNVNITVLKSLSNLGILTDEMQEVPEVLDNFVDIFNILSNTLSTLESVASNIISEKEELNQMIEKLKADLEQLQIKHNTEVTLLQTKVDGLDDIQQYYQQENDLLKCKLNEAIEIRDLENSIRMTKQEQYLAEKENTIDNLNSSLKNMENRLNENISKIVYLEDCLKKQNEEKHNLLKNILSELSNIAISFKIENNSCEDLVDTEIYEHILLTVKKISNHITFITLKNVDNDQKASKILTQDNVEDSVLIENNCDYTEIVPDIETNHKNVEKNKLSEGLLVSQQLLQDLQKELKYKTTQLDFMEVKVRDWKDQFESLDLAMKQKMEDLKIENEILKTRVEVLKRESQFPVDAYDDKTCRDKKEDIKITDRLYTIITQDEVKSPPSLLTICCNKIVSMEPRELESNSITTQNEIENTSMENDHCQCFQLQLELNDAKEENSRLLELLEEMEIINQQLLDEQNVVRSEIQLLLEPAQELHKKMISHRTNLSILTATTYAENKSLKSQVKVLQHHHKRFHNVCQRDIPEVKKQLSSLMTLLKGDPFIGDLQNLNFKRHYSLPDVLDSSTAPSNFKNESTLDGDVLMLDTNITITTTADNTFTGHDQTCLDITQFFNEACQTNDFHQVIDQNIQQVEICNCQNEMLQKLNVLNEENTRLRELVDKYSKMNIATNIQNSPIINDNHIEESVLESHNRNINCANCKELSIIKDSRDKVNEKLKELYEDFAKCNSTKNELVEKCDKLIIERDTMDAKLKKLVIYEKEYNSQKEEINKLNNVISIKHKELKCLQEENDTLSNQVMDNVSEVDDLTKALNKLKQYSNELEVKCNKLEQSNLNIVGSEKDDLSCSQCITKDKLIQTLQSKEKRIQVKLNRSLSDSDTSSRINKICTLQSELHAGREDCKELTEDVVTIKNHLERSNISMDLDESLADNSICAYPKDSEISSSQFNKSNMPQIAEEQCTDFYIMDKTDCFNYYAEKTGANISSFNNDAKIIEVMKMLYEDLIMKHGQEVENLNNKLKDYNEAKTRLQSQYDDLNTKFYQISDDLRDKNDKYSKFEYSLSQLRSNINIIHEEFIKAGDINNSKVIDMFKSNMESLDREFDFNSVRILDYILEKLNNNQAQLNDMVVKYTKLQNNLENVNAELHVVKENLLSMKAELASKENECTLLKLQKEKIHEISNAVTIDIVKREKELKDTIDKGYQRLIELGIIKPEKVDSNLPLTTNINILFDLLATESKRRHNEEKEKNARLLEMNKLTAKIDEKEKEIEILELRGFKLQEVNNAVTLDIVNKEKEVQTLKQMYEDLNKRHENVLQENKLNLLTIEKNKAEVNTLKTSILDNESTIETLEKELKAQTSGNCLKMSDLLETVTGLQNELTNLKRLNEMISKEKEVYAEELKKSAEALQKNNVDIDKMTNDILVLRESVRENGIVIENLNSEAKSLLKQNMELKDELEKKVKECSRLETNIKTHEKTAQIQTRMIMRIEKQKSDDDKKLEEFSQKHILLQKESEVLKAEIEQIKSDKEALQARVNELESSLEAYRNRPSIDAISDTSRRRRQSLHDSKRIFADEKYETGDDQNAEALFSARPKPDDLFMDVDDEGSARSSPLRHSKGRDSLSLLRTDQMRPNKDTMISFPRRKLQPLLQGKILGDKDEEHPSRPNSVLESRRRRQTLYDTHRLSHTPPPSSGDTNSCVSQLREQLASCQQDLEDLKEKYRELDEECETCSEYLKEREEQCSRLKKEKISLQHTITELKGKLQCIPGIGQLNPSKPKVADASVNTDEDWANLHAVVVDRMSYDAEVEKNKKLTKTIEELRFKKQDLKNTLAKMQKAFEKNIGNRELEATKSELQAYKQELSELKERYKELDEECETCAQYLRDKEEQCRRLKEAKSQLEAKLQELHTDINPLAHTSRKKRQNAHDQNRAAAVGVADAATETSEDLLSYQVERDGNVHAPLDDKHAKEVKHLKLAVERLSQQKSLLEQQLVSVSSAVQPMPMFVATGSAIVQNQQITDVMKENQKLKKINAKLVNICKKRGKESNRENVDPADQG
ncbi:unnamed protein product [Arctia plantaginis]|uniref:Kinesin motor domain-containing protein n=1 Tax=Arctia plantaginis TaxID=874455 RepID=A0A8S1B2M0_ARCPL|nr:unnamed protein product [Arctia plantaginis]